MADPQSTAAPVTYKPIPEFPGYRAGDDGTIWSCWLFGRGRRCHLSDRWRLRRSRAGERGYRVITLRRDGKDHHCQVHRLALQAFVGPCPPGMECCHEDGNPANNALTNLRWDTPQNNALDRVAHGRSGAGADNPRAKLSEADVLAARDRVAAGESMQSLADALCVHAGTIRHAVQGRTWKHTAGPITARPVPRECCRRGHPQTEGNVIVEWQDGRIVRRCRACRLSPEGRREQAKLYPVFCGSCGRSFLGSRDQHNRHAAGRPVACSSRCRGQVVNGYVNHRQPKAAPAPSDAWLLLPSG